MKILKLVIINEYVVSSNDKQLYLKLAMNKYKLCSIKMYYLIYNFKILNIYYLGTYFKMRWEIRKTCNNMKIHLQSSENIIVEQELTSLIILVIVSHR